MSINWGQPVGAGHSGGQMRVGLDFTQDPEIVDGETVSVTVTVNVWVWTKFSGYDAHNTCKISGDVSWSGSVSFTNTSDSAWSPSNQKKVKTLTRTFAPVAGVPRTTNVKVMLTGIEAIGTSYTAIVAGYWTTGSAPCAPAAPTITRHWDAYSPTNAPFRIAWQHNSLDGSAQDHAELLLAIDSVPIDLITIEGTQAYYDLDLSQIGAGNLLTAQVRTYGGYVDPGPYSSLESTVLADPPELAILAPAGDDVVVEELPVTVSWAVIDYFPLAAWTLELRDQDGTTYGTWSGTTESSRVLDGLVLPNETVFGLELFIRTGSGLTATAGRTFSTEYEGPAAPGVESSFDPSTLSCTVIGTAGEDEEKPATDHLVLQRIDTYKGSVEIVTLADPYTDSLAYLDRLPRLGSEVTYRVLAVAATGGLTAADTSVETAGPCCLNFGEDNELLLRLDLDVASQGQAGDDGEEFTFAGRPDPVSYGGEHTTRTITLGATLIEEVDLALKELLEEWRRPCTYRTPTGIRRRVKVRKVGESPSAEQTGISLDMIVVEG